MKFRPRSEAVPARTGCRLTAGLSVTSDGGRLSGVLLRAVGHGAALRAEPVALQAVRVPSETTGLLASLTADSPAESCAVGRIAALRAQFAEIQAVVLADLLSAARLPSAELLAVGLHGPGLWSRGRTTGYLETCDPARLAELSGVNVIDSLPARDVAAGGMGGPITALGEWLLLRDPRRSRCLVDLGRTLRLTYLPADRGPDPASRILAFDVGPGLRLLDQLAQRLTGGEHRFDPGGSLAVQGRRIAELADHWLADPSFRTPLPRWNPHGVRPERFLLGAIQQAVDHGWSIRDMLCTATHFLADSIAQAVTRRLAEDRPIDELVLTGGGQHNGMLLREIGVRLPQLPLRRLVQFGPSGEMFDAAAVAVLTLLHLDQHPANLPSVTGAESPRVLGRLTPATPLSWQRLLHSLPAGLPSPPLRKAV
jgi:anhydro-N-acetylmuramic acid kinase